MENCVSDQVCMRRPPKRKVPEHLNPYRNPDESEDDDYTDTDEEAELSLEQRLRGGRGRFSDEEDVPVKKAGEEGEDDEEEEECRGGRGEEDDSKGQGENSEDEEVQLIHDFFDPQEDAAVGRPYLQSSATPEPYPIVTGASCAAPYSPLWCSLDQTPHIPCILTPLVV